MYNKHPYPQVSTPVFSRLHLPWPTRRHPRAGDYRHIAGDILVATGLMTGDPKERATKRFEGSVVLDPYVYPYASLERVLTAGAFSQWLFFLDDQCDDHPEIGRNPRLAQEILDRYFTVLRTGTLPADPTPFARFSVYLSRRLSALAPPGWMPRFLGHVEDYLYRGSLASLEHWSRDTVPTLATYEPLRMYDSAVFPAVDIIEVAAGLSLPDEVMRHAALVEMGRITVRHVAFVNDLFSYQKEVLWRGTPWNLLRVLMHHENLGLEEAALEAVALVNRDVARFLELERQLPDGGPSQRRQVNAYVNGMKQWMRGNVDYSLASRRYRAPDSPFFELRSAPSAEQMEERRAG